MADEARELKAAMEALLAALIGLRDALARHNAVMEKLAKRCEKTAVARGIEEAQPHGRFKH